MPESTKIRAFFSDWYDVNTDTNQPDYTLEIPFILLLLTNKHFLKTTLSTLLFFWAVNANAQTPIDTIATKRQMGTIYLYKDQVLKPKQLLELMEPNLKAYTVMHKAKSNFDVATVFAFGGGFLIGWSIGSLIAKNEIDLRITGAGAVLIGVSIPFSIAYNRNTKKAVSIYNGNPQPSITAIRFKLNCGANSIGLATIF